ncbi:O-antigen ligase family protein [Staphylococcus simulans]|uniref:O-antigen ligase family protein n=1 Tax=Staphylococcus simulans TaxID=1286 RepID=UPI0028A358F5|nr:O-antigen ligase family protein [Staphylococcus simulans]MDT4011640.1 O-antigen ligase family protein [Staphylococcus simulans]
MKINLHEHKFTIKVSTIVIFILYLLIIIGSLNATESATVLIGTASLFLTFFIAALGILIYISKLVPFDKSQLAVLILILLLTMVCVTSISNNTFEMKDLINTIQMIACLLIIMYLSFIKISFENLKYINVLVAIFVLFHFIVWVAMGLPGFFASIYNNSNLIGPYMFYTSFFLILGIRYSKFKIIYIGILFISLILVFASDTRSILLSIAATIFVFLFWKFLTKYQIIAVLFFALIIILSISFVYIYPMLPTFRFFTPIEQWMLDHTGKSIMSGRNDLWIPLIELINEKPWFGYSPGTMAEELYSHDQSPHNLYLNILMQIGYLGLILISAILLIIWNAMVKQRDNFIVKLSASYFLGVIVHQSFEITLFQNQLSVGLLQVFIMGVGYSVATNLNKESKMIIE